VGVLPPPPPHPGRVLIEPKAGEAKTGSNGHVLFEEERDKHKLSQQLKAEFPARLLTPYELEQKLSQEFAVLSRRAKKKHEFINSRRCQ
jgi:hypothetical protein